MNGQREVPGLICAGRAQALELAGHEVAYALGQRPVRRMQPRRVGSDRAHRLDDDKGVAFAGRPHLLRQALTGLRAAALALQRSHQRPAVELAQRPAKCRRGTQVFRARGQHVSPFRFDNAVSSLGGFGLRPEL